MYSRRSRMKGLAISIRSPQAQFKKYSPTTFKLLNTNLSLLNVMINCNVIVKKQEDEVGAFYLTMVVKQPQNPTYSSLLKETYNDKNIFFCGSQE